MRIEDKEAANKRFGKIGMISNPTGNDRSRIKDEFLNDDQSRDIAKLRLNTEFRKFVVNDVNPAFYDVEIMKKITEDGRKALDSGLEWLNLTEGLPLYRDILQLDESPCLMIAMYWVIVMSRDSIASYRNKKGIRRPKRFSAKVAKK